MKEPKLSHLKIDIAGTKKIRSKMAKVKKVKITINLDSDILSAVKLQAEESGVPYQNLINRLLRRAIAEQLDELTRISKVEKELRALKRRVG